MSIIIEQNVSIVGKLSLHDVGTLPGKFLVRDANNEVSERTAGQIITDLNMPELFTDLRDTPDSYVGHGNSVPVVNDAENKLEFVKREYIHDQGTPSSVWNITHGLKKERPTVKAESSAGTVVVGQVDYIDDDTLTITFNHAFSGEASIT